MSRPVGGGGWCDFLCSGRAWFRFVSWEVQLIQLYLKSERLEVSACFTALQRGLWDFYVDVVVTGATWHCLGPEVKGLLVVQVLGASSLVPLSCVVCVCVLSILVRTFS